MQARPTGFLTVSRKGGKSKVAFTLSGAVFQEGSMWVAHCRELDLSTCGATKDEALGNVREAIGLFFDSCIKRNTLEDALIQLGWVCLEQGRKVACTPGMLPLSTPPAFVIDAIKQHGHEWSTGVSLAG